MDNFFYFGQLLRTTCWTTFLILDNFFEQQKLSMKVVQKSCSIHGKVVQKSCSNSLTFLGNHIECLYPCRYLQIRISFKTICPRKLSKKVVQYKKKLSNHEKLFQLGQLFWTTFSKSCSSLNNFMNNFSCSKKLSKKVVRGSIFETEMRYVGANQNKSAQMSVKPTSKH